MEECGEQRVISNPVYDINTRTTVPGSIQCTTAMFPGIPFSAAVERIAAKIAERPELAMDWIQLCPQSYGVVDEGLITDLKRHYPRTKFQLHSNVRLKCGKTPVHGSSHGEWVNEYLETFERLTLLSGCGIYSLHSGYADEMTLNDMFENVREWNRQYNIIIAVEGLYPERRRQALISTWTEYEQLLHADIPYAIDLSHLHIVATTERKRPLQLVRDLLRSQHCREIHLSANNGRVDAHQPWSESNSEWWWEVLDSRHDQCVVFCEENLQTRRNHLGRHI